MNGHHTAVLSLSALSVKEPPYLPKASNAQGLAILLFLIAVLSMFDLSYTLFANDQGQLFELNPIAASLFAKTGSWAVIAFKLLSLAVGSLLLWRSRSSRWTMPACWLLLLVYAGLGIQWVLWSQTYAVIAENSVPMGPALHAGMAF